MLQGGAASQCIISAMRAYPQVGERRGDLRFAASLACRDVPRPHPIQDVDVGVGDPGTAGDFRRILFDE